MRWVAHLARLELSAADLALMTRQLSAILDYVNQLQQVDTEGVEPLAHPLPIHNVFRADEPRPSLRVDEFGCVPENGWPGSNRYSARPSDAPD